MIVYVCVEREGEFGLHLYVCKEMILYFFAGGHWNYARDSIVNLIMSVSVLLFSNFKKINWLLTKLYMDVFRDANQLISINNRIIPSQCDPIIDCFTCVIWLQLCDHNGCHRPVKDPDVMSKGKTFIANVMGEIN